jgi:hypothetical protein
MKAVERKMAAGKTAAGKQLALGARPRTSGRDTWMPSVEALAHERVAHLLHLA